jgi:hypothetical protein
VRQGGHGTPGAEEATNLKKKLEDAEQKAKDAASDLQAVVEGESSMLPWADSACLTRSCDLELLQALEGPRRPSRRSWPRSRAN